jgi:hypothetical protein
LVYFTHTLWVDGKLCYGYWGEANQRNERKQGGGKNQIKVKTRRPEMTQVFMGGKLIPSSASGTGCVPIPGGHRGARHAPEKARDDRRKILNQSFSAKAYSLREKRKKGVT